MLFNRLFCRKSSDSSANSASSKGVKLNKNNHQPRRMALEPLESRDLLTVTTGAIDDAEYSQIRAQYPDFNLPELQADLNVMTITPDDGALSLSDLKSAIADAGTTTQPDLILVRTSASANSVTYASNADEISINIDATQYGSITILGWGEEKFTLDANQQSRVMTVDGSSSVVNLGGLMITNGNSQNSASNIYDGGGIYNYGTLTITNSTISGNTAYSYGGGIYNYGSNSTLTVTNSTISGNTANSSGGGIYNDGSNSTLTITNSTISGNIADYGGGGIYIDIGTATIINSTISENTANDRGGGIYNWGTLTITNSTISGNTANSSGGGIYNNSGTLTITNSIVSRNYNGNISGNLSETSSNNLIGYYPNFVCGPIFDSEGKLTNADTMDLHLRSDSIAIDKGDNTAVENLEADIEGYKRIFGEIVDIGAYEYQGDRNDEPIPYSTVVNTLNDSFDLNDDEWSLREAIYYASEYVTITFADELEGTIVLTLGQLDIEVPLAIDGDNRITIDANQKSRVFYISGGTEEKPVVLNGLTIQNGNATEGGGIYNARGTLTITNSTIAGNTASSGGGGIYNNYGTTIITNSTIAGNTTSSGGGGIYNNYGTTIITNSTISENTALGSNSQGGGVYNYAYSNNGTATLTITNSTISGNTAYTGGGIYNYAYRKGTATLAITNSMISGNTASYSGGGIYNDGYVNGTATLTITNSVIAGNTAASGGGIVNYSSGRESFDQGSGTATITNSTIAGNSASYVGGIYNDASNSNLTITNSIVSRNSSGNIRGDLSLNSSNNLIVGNYLGFVSVPQYDAEGNLTNINAINWGLRSDSIAIDKGDNSAINDIETDIEGNARIFGEIVDIGAYEYQGDRNDEPIPYSTVVNTLNDSFDLTDDEWSLREAIYYAPEYVTITFADKLEGTIVLTLGQLDIDVPLAIDGDNRITIDANQKSRVLYISGGTEEKPVVLNGLTIQNGNTFDSNSPHLVGGGIYNDNGALIITNSTISGNTACDEGGGILNSGVLTVTNSTISGNTAKCGGGICNIGVGELTVTNSTISGNTASGGYFSEGGGIYNGFGTVTITNSTISGNAASNSNAYSYGGGIYNNSGTLTITNSTISENTASGGSISPQGGGIYNYGVLTVTNSTISENTISGSYSSGGGIYIDDCSTTAITSCTISENTASSGGGIYNHGTTTITDSTISGNTASESGGGIYNRYATLIITNSTIAGNTASSEGGGIFYSGSDFSPLTITNSTISGNTASGSNSQSGGIYVSGATTIINSIVSKNYNGNIYGDLSETSHNNLIDDYYLGFVCAPLFDSEGKLTNADTMDLHLRSNSVAVDKGDSSAVENLETDIEGNTRIYGETVDIGAYEYQGDRNDEPYSTVVNTLNDSFDLTDKEWSLREAIYYAPEYVTITFSDDLEGTIVLTLGQLDIEVPLAIDGDNCIAIDADQKSRVFYISGGTEEKPVSLNGLTIQKGNAEEGGGIYTSGITAITTCTITGNIASSNGGGIYNNYGTITITNSTLAENTASSAGGIYNYSGDLTITNSTIADNTASDNGGGIYSNGTTTITNSTISGNTASGNGGGIYSNGTTTITNSTIAKNTASSAGGIYNYSGDFTITNSTISENTATDSSSKGGGIYKYTGTTTITNCTISENTASSGGGIYKIYGTTTITNSTIAKNSSSSDGGGIYNYSRTLTITNSTILENTANSGGGIYNYGYNDTTTLTISNCTISENTAKSGGGIYNYGYNKGTATLIITNNSTIERNTASYGGGIYNYGYNGTATLTITNCTIAGNTASNSNGGGIYNDSYSKGTVNLTITNCTIAKNMASRNGGGIDANGTITITNSTISGNTASGNGGGIYNYDYNDITTLTINNCTISENTANSGGGIYNSSGTTNVYNTIVAGNIENNGVDVYKSSGSINAYNSLSSYTAWDSGSDNIVYDPNIPLFYNAENGDYRLVKGSQAIDKGSNQYACNAAMDEFSTDIIGEPRFIGDNIDIGAYEYFGINSSQDCIYIGNVTFSWTQYKNTANVRLTWVSGAAKTVLGTFASADKYTWDTTAFENGSGQLVADYLDENGFVLFTSTLTSIILNSNENVAVHQGSISTSQTWSADKVHLVVGQINILSGGSLTIAQNAVVKFWKNAYINTYSGSTLTVEDNAVFTRMEDDSVAGDTNLDGNLSVPKFGNEYIRGKGTHNVSPYITMKYVTTLTSGTISTNQIWYNGQVYRVTGDVTIASGATLTIQPGAIVKFNSGKSIIVQSGGTLNAQGTVAQPIVFTSVKDDEYGGDTNEDDGFYSPAAGDWNQIKVLGTAKFDHAVIRYTGAVSGSNGAIYGTRGCNVTFNNSVLEFSKYYALSFDGGTFNSANSVFREGQTALVNMHNSGCYSRFVNCTFADSSMFLWCGWGNTKFTNCIVSNITSKFVGYGSGNPSRGAFTNCVFYNPKSSGPQSFSFVGSNGNIWANPLFRNASAGDYYLMAGSPCIDAGTSDGAPETDITGAPRANDPYSGREGVVDIGAYEFVDGVVSAIDLEPVNVQAPSSVTTGDAATIQWTIRNNGSAAASGSWTDAIYLVNETSGQSVLVKECVHAGDIAPGALQTFYTDVVVPNAADGTWKFQLRVNPNREIFEGVNIDNNFALAESSTVVQTPFLTDSQGVIFAKKNQVVLYRVIVNAGDSFSLQTSSEKPISIYMRENYVPNASNYDFAGVEYQPNCQTLFIASADTDRTFYLLAETTADIASIEYAIQNQAALSVLSVSPQEASNKGTSTFTFTGTGFNSSMTVSLQNGPKTIVGTNLAVISGSSASATFDLTGQQPGEYTLVVSSNGQTASCSSAITVKEGKGTVVNYWVDMPQSVRAERVYAVKLNYENAGDCDALLPIFTLKPSGDVLLGWSADSVTETELYALGVGADSSAGILKAGESGSVTFYVLAKNTTIVSCTQWNGAVSNMFDSSYWTTWDEFHSDLSDAVTRLALRGNKNMSYIDAYAFLVTQKYGDPTTGLSGTLRNSRTGEPISGVYLSASWDNDNGYDFAITDDNGHYAFNYLPKNTHLSIAAEGIYGLSQTETYLGQTDSTNFDLTALPYGSISGRVMSEVGQGLENQLVLAWTEDGQYGIAYTDSQGRYEIYGLPLGQYSVDVESAGAFQSPAIESVNVSSVNGVIGVNFNLVQGEGYAPQAALSNDEFTTIVETFDELTFPESADNLNVIRLIGDEFNAMNLIRAIYIASCTTDDDVILVDSSNTIELNGSPIEICIDEENFGTVSIIGAAQDHAKIKVNSEESTFFISSGVLQLGAINFMSIATDDDWMNLASVIDVFMTTDGSIVAGEVHTQDVNFYDKQGNNIFETYFELIEENGEYYYTEIGNPDAYGALSTMYEGYGVGNSKLLEANSDDDELYSHNYVLIFSGGGTPKSNYSFYYQNVKDLYTTCVNKYHIPKKNIYLIYADGESSYNDSNINLNKDTIVNPILINSNMSFANGSHIYSATQENLIIACNELRTKLSSDDHILVYTFDHGNKDISESLVGFSTIKENVDFIYDNVFASNVNFNAYTTYVLCQCFSGGVLEEISMDVCPSRYGMSSCSKSQTSWGETISRKFIRSLNKGYQNGTSISGKQSFNKSQYTLYSTNGKWVEVTKDEYDAYMKWGYETDENNGKYMIYAIECPKDKGDGNFPIFQMTADVLDIPELKTKKITNTSITLEWNPIPGASYYLFEYTNKATGSSKSIKTSACQYTFSGLNASTAYDFKASAIANPSEPIPQAAQAASITSSGEHSVTNLGNTRYMSSQGEYTNSPWSSILTVCTAPQSSDPNEIIGPVGGDFVTHDEGTEDEPFMVIDGANWITNNPNQENEYKIYFENKSTATAAAQEIYVSTALPAEMDWDSFQVDAISIGNEIYTLTDDCLIGENTWLVNQSSTGEQIKIRYSIDSQTGEVLWYLRSYVATTADNFPVSAYDGFLPPNDDNHSGEGYIAYRVKYDSDLTTGDVVSTSATIVFDTNEPIETNVWLNTIDVDIPFVQMDSAELVGGGVALTWSGSDVGSGIEQYQIYVSTDGAAYTLWQSFESDVTSAVFDTQTPGEYSFYILAVDGAGNIGGDPEQTTPSFLIESDMEMRVVTTSDVHASTDVISDNLETITDWDAFYMEFWTTNLKESQPGKTSTAKIIYDSNVFQLDTNRAIAAPAGITAAISDPILESNGMTSIIVTFTVGEDGYTAPGANTYWGAVHFTPNMQDGAGIQNPLESESLDVEMGGAASGTTVKAMPYDLNRDGKVNVDDFILFATVYGTNTTSVSAGDGMYTEKLLSDYDGDGAVNVADFIAFATNYGLVKGDGKNVTLPQQNPQSNGSAIPNNSTVSESIVVEQPVTNVLPESVATVPIQGASEQIVAVQSTSPVYEIAIESELKSAVQVLRQAHSSALLDLYDNQNQSATPTALFAKAVDESLAFDDDSFDFLFDESDSDADDSSDVDLSAVLDELELELI